MTHKASLATPLTRLSLQLTLRGLMVFVGEAALVCAVLAGLPEAEAVVVATVAVVPLMGAFWGGMRGRRKVIGGFRGGVFAAALQSALFALWKAARLVTGQVGRPDFAATASAAFEIAVVLVTSLCLGAILGLLVGKGLALAAPPSRRPSAAGTSQDELTGRPA